MPLRVFPVAGGARFTDDWGDPRSGGRSHAGNDLFNAEGTPLLAADDGEVRYGADVLGGNVANLRSPDGTRYYYAHLSAFEGVNRQVRAGDVIGYMGHTGNAVNTPTHLHFEVHPGEGAAVDPFPLLSTAQRVSALQRPSTSLAWPLFFVAAVGLGLWAYSNVNVHATQRLLRRFSR